MAHPEAAASAPARVDVLAPAKINLALHVTGRRADGYHLLDTIAVFAGLADRIELRRADRLSLEVCGPFAGHAPGDATDLAWRAAVAFSLRAGIRASAAIRLDKRIPAGAGLGGGSADAGAVLHGMNRLYGAGIEAGELSAVGLGLGADVPICMTQRGLRARGIGEAIEAVADWPALPVVLVWPGRPVSTAAAFAALSRRDNPGLPPPAAAACPGDVAAWLSGCRNDLEEPALGLAPEIGDVLTALRADPECLLARMSGSGSACFGLYEDGPAAERAAGTIRAARPDWWVAATEAR